MTDSHNVPDANDSSVRQRLLDAARASFLSDDYHKVSTRLIADRADANVSIIRYYFGNKEGSYEEMIRETLAPLLKVLDGQRLSSVAAFNGHVFAAGLAPGRHS